MFGTSCVLLCAVSLSYQAAFKYTTPWDSFRRSNSECEMCDHDSCLVTNSARCEYYAEASKIMCDDDDGGKDTNNLEEEIEDARFEHGSEEGKMVGRIDSMMYVLVDTATSTSVFKMCVPFISQYSDCTEENICLGCKFCTCNEEGRWICAKQQQCRPGPKMNVDHRVIGIVADSLTKKGKPHNRYKRSAASTQASVNNEGKLTYKDISKWLYELDSLDFEETSDRTNIPENINNEIKTDINIYEDIDENTLLTMDIGSPYTDNVTISNTPSYVDILEFNDILKNWAIDSESTDKPTNIIKTTKTPIKHDHLSHDDLTEYDPIRLIKRETSWLEANDTHPKIDVNSTSSHVANVQMVKDAVYGLNKIINEKQKELDELLHIQDNLMKIAKSHNTSIDLNSTTTYNNYSNHQIAIYKIDAFEKCISKLKHDMYHAIENIIETETLRNSSSLSTDLKVLLSMIKKYIFNKHHNNHDVQDNVLPSPESEKNSRRYMEPDYHHEIFNPVIYLSNILVEINKAPTKPLDKLSHHVRKILKRVIIRLYFDDFAIIDLILHETHYEFNKYLENIGIKWDKMMRDLEESEVSDELLRTKLFHMTLKADIGKIEDMISVLEFAKNRRMTVANGAVVEKAVTKIRTNLARIDSKVQEIIKLQKIRRTRTIAPSEHKPVNKTSIMQKLKKIFQNSRNEIKNMLRKNMPKSEIMKEIAKKKMDELEKQRMLEYQETMKKWQEKLNVDPRRKKRSPWGFNSFVDRIKSIIPGYLRKKVKPAINSKNKGNKTRPAKEHGRKRKQHTTSTTVRTSHKDQIKQNITHDG